MQLQLRKKNYFSVTSLFLYFCVNQNVTSSAAEPMSLWVELTTKYALLKRYWRTSNIATITPARSLSSVTRLQPRRNGSSSVYGRPLISLNPLMLATASELVLPQQPLLQGLEDSIIQKMGRWNSSAYLTYIRTPKDQLASVAKALTKPHRTG